jgi:hypothetical protein
MRWEWQRTNENRIYGSAVLHCADSSVRFLEREEGPLTGNFEMSEIVALSKRLSYSLASLGSAI